LVNATGGKRRKGFYFYWTRFNLKKKAKKEGRGSGASKSNWGRVPERSANKEAEMMWLRIESPVLKRKEAQTIPHVEKKDAACGRRVKRTSGQEKRAPFRERGTTKKERTILKERGKQTNSGQK